MGRQPHAAHVFDRVVATSQDDDRVVYGCSYRSPGMSACPETEVRRRNQPSPFAVKRAKRKAATRKPRGGS